MHTHRSEALGMLLYEKLPLAALFIDQFPFRRSSVGTFIRQQPISSSSSSVDSSRGKTSAPRLDYRSMVSVEDMPKLFASFDSKYRDCIRYLSVTYFIHVLIGMDSLI